MNDVKKRVERYALDRGNKEVVAETVFSAKPDIDKLYPQPFNANYERHLGPVTGLNCSPFLKRLFLTCSVDGSVRMYDVLNSRPVAVFDPSFGEYL